jgi:aminopeptidase N
MGQTIAMGLYPVLLVDDTTITATDSFLARTDLNAALRRLVEEGRDSVLRAMRARAADAAS